MNLKMTRQGSKTVSRHKQIELFQVTENNDGKVYSEHSNSYGPHKRGFQNEYQRSKKLNKSHPKLRQS